MPQLFEEYAAFFQSELDPGPDAGNLDDPKEARKQKYHHRYFVAIDAEWHADGRTNNVLSYQIACCSAQAYQNKIYYQAKGTRRTLADLIELAIKSVNNDRIPDDHDGRLTLVVLISHNMVAEWSVLADRDDQRITDRLTLIRRTIVTGQHPIPINIEKRYPIDVRFADTMLLAPAGFGSLEKLSSLVPDQNKIPIPLKFKERMDLFLRHHPEDFERYALQDSQACLHLFFLLQKTLNDVTYPAGLGKIHKYFLTIGSAAVTSFLVSNPEHQFYRMGLSLAKIPETIHRNKGTVGDSDPWDKVEEDELFRLFLKGTAERFQPTIEWFVRGYYGGRNESFFIGDTNTCDRTAHQVWIDIDIQSCYPSTMSTCPQIDLMGDISFLPVRYRIDDRVKDRLIEQGVPVEIVTSARQALRQSVETFETFLAKKVKNKKSQMILRRYASVPYDNILDRWWKRLQEGVNLPAVGRVRFAFPEGTEFPSLPIRDSFFGLIYPLEGECDAPACEIVQAMEAGAKIELIAGVELPIAKDFAGEQSLLLVDHFRMLIEERQKYKNDRLNPKAQVFEKLLKEFANSLYGKFAQGINPRRTYSLQTGLTNPLMGSKVSDPIIASLTTGLARAALSSIMTTIEQFNRNRVGGDKITVISATTDGLCIGVPAPVGYTLERDYYVAGENGPILCAAGYNKKEDTSSPPAPDLEEVFQRFGIEGLFDLFQESSSLRMLQQSRKRLTGSANFLEIKHMVDQVVSIKTRGAIGILASGAVTMLARFGHKPPLSTFLSHEEYERVMAAGGVERNNRDAEWLLEQIDRKEQGDDTIGHYSFYSLAGARVILESQGEIDLIRLEKTRAINTDFDWKRKILAAEEPWTSPHRSIKEMRAYRGQMQNLRRKGLSAGTEIVLSNMARRFRNTRTRGGEAAHLLRQLLRGTLGSPYPLGQIQKDQEGKKRTRQEIADTINKIWREVGETCDLPVRRWTVEDIKTAQKQPMERKTVLQDRATLAVLDRWCDSFQLNREAMADILFVALESRDEVPARVRALCRAILLAPQQGIDPFRQWHRQQKLPTSDELLAIFTPIITALDLAQIRGERFESHQLPASEKPEFITLFKRIGLKKEDAERAANAMIERGERRKAPRVDPAVTTCLTQFVSMLYQPDYYAQKGKQNEIIKALTPFGLTEQRLRTMRTQRFTPGSVGNTPENRQSLIKMAKALGLDPSPAIQVLLRGN